MVVAVREAKTLTSLDELNLSDRTRKYLKKKGWSIDEAIWSGREAAFNLRIWPEKGVASALENLARALNEAGFIRNDITLRSFCIGGLYSALYPEMADYGSTPKRFNDLYLVKGVDELSADYQVGNKRYEEFPEASEIEEKISLLSEELEAWLFTGECKVVRLYFGFTESGQRYGYREIAEKCQITLDRVRQILGRVIRKLRRVPSILDEINPNKVEITLDTDIEWLYLTAKAENALKRAGINTVAEVISYPMEDWRKIRQFGQKCFQEVEERIERAGFRLGLPQEEIEKLRQTEDATNIPIGELGLSNRLDAVLIGSGIKTLGDILDATSQTWCLVDGLRIDDLVMIEDKMHDAGYISFKIFAK